MASAGVNIAADDNTISAKRQLVLHIMAVGRGVRWHSPKLKQDEGRGRKEGAPNPTGSSLLIFRGARVRARTTGTDAEGERDASNLTIIDCRG